MRAFLLALAMTLGGCYLGPQKVTYPSPHPAGGLEFHYPAAEAPRYGYSGQAPWSSFVNECRPARSGAEYGAVAFRSGDAELCYLAPGIDEAMPCMRINGSAKQPAPLVFEVRASAVGLEFRSPRARLQSDAQALNAEATWTRATAFGRAPSTTGTPALTVVLRFSFPAACAPEANYRLEVNGLFVDGAELALPIVAFTPHEQWNQAYLD